MGAREYFAVQCGKCMRFYCSQSEKHHKCTFCGSKTGEIKLRQDKPQLISEYVKRANGKHLYEDFQTAQEVEENEEKNNNQML